MREILFRGLFDKSKLGNDDLKECFIYGDLIQTSCESIIRERDTNIEWIVHKDSIGQYTGLCDRTGKKIFEGDIINIVERGVKIENLLICFKLGSFLAIKKDVGDDIRFLNVIEVIGNMHENPELLEVK